MLPFGYALVVYLTVWFSGLGGFYNEEFVNNIAKWRGWTTLPPGMVIALHVIFVGTLRLPMSCLTALGEEIGWRGFLVPELAKITTFSRISLLSGAIWSIWHLPVILAADYNISGTPAWYGLTCFTIMVIGMSFVLTWIRLKSGSVWPGMFLHASHNTFINGVADRLTTDTGITEYIIGEFGAALALVALILGYIFWKRRLALPDTRIQPEPAFS